MSDAALVLSVLVVALNQQRLSRTASFSPHSHVQSKGLALSPARNRDPGRVPPSGSDDSRYPMGVGSDSGNVGMRGLLSDCFISRRIPATLS